MNKLYLPWARGFAGLPVLLALLVIAEFNTARSADLTARWILPGNGSWHDPAHWSDNVVPVNGDDRTFHAVIDLANEQVQVNVNQSLDVSRLTLHDHLNVGSGEAGYDLRILDFFHWSDGVLGGWESRYICVGEALFDGNTIKILERQCDLILEGHARWTEGHLHVGGYGEVWIRPGGVLSAEANGYIGDPISTADALIRNDGTLRIDSPGKTVTIYSPIANSGIVEVVAGEARFNSPLTIEPEGSGTLRVEPMGRAVFVDTSNWSRLSMENSGEIVISGTILLDPETATSFRGQLTLTGQLEGAGDAIVEDGEMIAQSARFFGDGLARISPGGKMRVSGSQTILDRNLVNEGEWTLGAGAVSAGLRRRFTNRPQATIELETGLHFVGAHDNSAVLSNEGMLLKRDDFGPATVGPVFENHGEVRAAAGMIRFQGEVTGPGIWTADRNGQIVFLDQAIFDAESRWSGTGTFVVDGRSTMEGEIGSELELVVTGNLNLGGESARMLRALTVRSQSDASFETSGTVGIVERFEWRGGVVQGSGSVHVLDFSLIDVPDGAQATAKSPIRWEGVTDWVRGRLVVDGATSENSGVMTIRGAAVLQFHRGSFLNLGRIGSRENIHSMSLTLTDDRSDLSTTTRDLSGPITIPSDGPLFVNGRVQLNRTEVTFHSGSSAALSHVAMTDRTLNLESDAELRILESARFTDSVVLLDGGVLQLAPMTVWSNSTIRGAGSLVADEMGPGFHLHADQFDNPLRVVGSVLMGSSDRVTLTVDAPEGILRASRLVVEGPIRLGGALDLVSAFPTDTLLAAVNPVVLIESSDPIEGGFENAPNGAWVTTLDGSFRFRLHYGPQSQFPSHLVMLEQFGTSYDLWRREAFEVPLHDDFEVTGPNFDHDGDGRINLVDFATQGIEGPTFDQESLPGQLLVTISVSKSAIDRTPAVRWLGSTDLVSWTEPTLHRVYETSNSVTYVYRYPSKPAAYFLSGWIDWP